MSNIYELTGNYKQVMQLIESGELDDEMLQDTLEAIEGDLEVKAENYGFIAKNSEGIASMLDWEITRLQERSKYYKNHASTLKQTVFDMMAATDNKGFKTDHFTFATRKSESVDIVDSSLIAPLLLKEKITYSPDKKAIKEVIKAGIEVPGAEIVTKLNYSMK